PAAIDRRLPGGDDPRLDALALGGGVASRVARTMNKCPGGADVALGVDRIALAAVRSIAGIRIIDGAVGFGGAAGARILMIARRGAGLMPRQAARRLRLRGMTVTGNPAI